MKMKSTRPYQIWWQGWTHQSGGVRALYALRRVLEEHGCHAFMPGERTLPTDAITVYPEVIPGNPARAKQAVRWLLNRPSEPLPANDQWFQWGGGLTDSSPTLTVDIFEPDLWRPGKRESGKVAYWIGKGQHNYVPGIVPSDAIEIRKDNYPNRYSLAQLVRSLDMLVSFDPYTALITEATLSGVPVLVHAPGDPFVDVAKQHPWNRYGVAWSTASTEQYLHAIDTVDEARDWYYGVCVPTFDRQVEHFITATQEG